LFTEKATEEVVPLGEVNLTVIRPEETSVKMKLRLAVEASVVLVTGEPASRVTFRPVLVVDASIVVPAGGGFRWTPFCSPT
jgi:hypothetical protein